MRKRSTEILGEIARHPDALPSVSRLASRYGVSERTIRNDFREISAFLEPLGSGCGIEVTTHGDLVCGPSFDAGRVLASLREMDTYTYKLSAEERQEYILAALIAADGYLTMGQIAERLSVSRNTIVSDVAALGRKLDGAGIGLSLSPGKGMELACSRGDRMDLLLDVYRKVLSSTEGEGYLQQLVLGMFDIRFNYAEVLQGVREFIEANRLVFIDQALYDVTLYIFVALNFETAQGAPAPEGSPATLPDCNPSEIAYVMLYVGRKLGVEVRPETFRRFQAYLDKSNLASFIKSIDQVEFYKAIVRFLMAVDPEDVYGLVHDDVLVEALLAHILSFKDWGDFEIELPEENAGIDYVALEKLVDENVWILEELLPSRLNENVRRSIVIHICAGIIRNRPQSSKISVAIVCPSSVATGKYLEAQVETYFDFNIVGLFSAREAIEEIKRLNERVDFIISTVSISTDDYEVIKVHPFFQMDDLNRIQRMILQKRSFLPVTRKDLLFDYIQSTVSDKGLASNLQQAVERTIDGYSGGMSLGQHNALASMLDVSDIVFCQSATDWRSGIRSAAAPLLAAGSIEERYVDAMLENVNLYGDYFVIGDGVALAHAASKSGVVRDGLSLLVSREGVRFDETASPVHLLFCFAVRDAQDYVSQLNCIVALGQNRSKVELVSRLDDPLVIWSVVVSG